MGAKFNGVDFDSIPRHLQSVVVMAVGDTELDPTTFSVDSSFEFTINGERIDIIKFAKRVNDWTDHAHTAGYLEGKRDGKESAIRALATLIENEE